MTTLQATLEEVKVMSLLNHPHIIKYHSSFLANGALTIIMEFATKGTLDEYLRLQQELLPQKVNVYNGTWMYRTCCIFSLSKTE